MLLNSIIFFNQLDKNLYDLRIPSPNFTFQNNFALFRPVCVQVERGWIEV